MTDRDTLYAKPHGRLDAFRFDEKVAAVFADMIGRSVPGYELTLQMIAVAAQRFAVADTNCYDLGCSLGAALLQIRHNVPASCHVIGVDNAPAMVERCRAIIAGDDCATRVSLRCEDVLGTEVVNASLVTLNFTLQFIPLERRGELMATIHRALVPGGCLVISEKIANADEHEQNLLQELHHQFKELQGYSRLEIAQKRAALEDVLIPETLEAHRERLFGAGFSRVTPWLQCLNFQSLLAEK